MEINVKDIAEFSRKLANSISCDLNGELEQYVRVKFIETFEVDPFDPVTGYITAEALSIAEEYMVTITNYKTEFICNSENEYVLNTSFDDIKFIRREKEEDRKRREKKKRDKLNLAAAIIEEDKKDLDGVRNVEVSNYKDSSGASVNKIVISYEEKERGF